MVVGVVSGGRGGLLPVLGGLVGLGGLLGLVGWWWWALVGEKEGKTFDFLPG